MDDFDIHLEQELARVLDPIICAKAPGRSGSWRDGRRGRALRALILPDGGPVPILVPEAVPGTVPAVFGAPLSAG